MGNEKHRIDIRGGYVELKEYVTRKMAREWMTGVADSEKIGADGNAVVTPQTYNEACERLVLDMIDRVVILAADGTEQTREISSDWLDELPEDDFAKISEYVLEKFNGSRKKAKK